MTERISFGVLLENKGYNKTAVALAGDPGTEESLLYLQRSLLPGGRYIDGSGQTIIGAGLAADLKLAVGDMLKVVSQASDGSLQLKKLRIVGIFRDRGEHPGRKDLPDAHIGRKDLSANRGRNPVHHHHAGRLPRREKGWPPGSLPPG